MKPETRAPRNRTLSLGTSEKFRLSSQLLTLENLRGRTSPVDRVINGDASAVLERLADRGLAGRVQLLLVDPPYNLTKVYNGARFSERSGEAYSEWLDGWIELTKPLLHETASVYVCSEWRSSGAVQRVLEKHFMVRNRITWEREKGRGAARNWKNCSEDIWFCSVSNAYYFNVDAVKQKRQVRAPYRDGSGKPKDWQSEADGNFRVTHPSNLWTDISVPFWSMAENTEHPTQKPEKLVAKLLLASSQPGDLVLDPFLGSGTTAVAAKKLGRHFVGIELEKRYCLLAAKRLELAAAAPEIQGYADGVFWERNSFAQQPGKARKNRANHPKTL